ncbi:antibiotic biosynthesis monooxygenase family protein [Streptomyces sp. NPDC088261]|uniref:antibiotic biosynthesis monooxygenase family protein n=1 Tax=Streptomyces sp. NPDC088261 TaxID=3365851 RepID=UPI003814F9FF
MDNQPTSVTFVNRFTVTGEPKEFEEAFSRTADFMTGQPGILGYTLSQDTEDPQRFVNIARWKNAQSLRAAVSNPDFQAHVGELRKLATSESRLYSERQRYLDGGDTAP